MGHCSFGIWARGEDFQITFVSFHGSSFLGSAGFGDEEILLLAASLSVPEPININSPITAAPKTLDIK